MGGGTASVSAPRINQLAVQTSALGLPVSRGWGTSRIKCNLLWFGAFRSLAKTETTGGKGGGVKNTTYSYTASVILGLCRGVVPSIRTVYRDKDVYTGSTALAKAGLSLATGTIGQAPWAYLTSQFPSEALGYSGTAYVYAQDYSLTDSASLQNHSFEVQFSSRVSGLDDADPSVVVQETIQETPGWPSGMVASLTTYGDYCLSAGLLLSPALEQQQTVSDFLGEILQATNSEAIWSEGQIKIRTYGDQALSGNGRTFTPDLTPVYNLTEDDFIPQGGPEGPPVTQEIVDQSDAYNIVQVEYLDRANQYNTAIATAQDLDNIIQYGPRKKDPISLHAICDSQVAQQVAQLILQRLLYRRERFQFQLPWNFVLLEPMDYVTLTTTTDQLRLSSRLVQIREIEEDETGNLTFHADGVETGTGSTTAPSVTTGAGYSPNTSVPAPSVTSPVLINAPTSLTGQAPALWVAAASDQPNWGGCQVWVSVDGTNYQLVGVVDSPARYGSLTSAIVAGGNPDTTHTLAVSLVQGQLDTASQQDADAGATLCWVDGEVLSYRDATLTGTRAYNLQWLRRGLYGTTGAAHASGSRFVRLDDAVFRYEYQSLGVGSALYVKLPSFNQFGQGAQSLADVSAYTITLNPVVSRDPIVYDGGNAAGVIP